MKNSETIDVFLNWINTTYPVRSLLIFVYIGMALLIAPGLTYGGHTGTSSLGIPNSYAQSIAPPQNSIINASFFGVSVASGGTSLPSIVIGTEGKSGPSTVWATLEPKENVYNWTQMDQEVAAAQKAGIKNITYAFYDVPAWASSDPTESCGGNPNGACAAPKNVTDFTNFVKAFATRYKGEVTTYELWNEFTSSTSWKSGNATQLLTFTAAAYNTIKKVDPNATVIGPSTDKQHEEGSTIPLLEQYLQAGGAKYAQGLAFHGYACNESLGGKCGKSPSNIDCVDPIDCAGQPLINEINNIRTVEKNAGVSLPLYDTEGGVGGNGVSEAGEGQISNITLAQAYIARWYIIQASYGVKLAVWFNYRAGDKQNTFTNATYTAYNQTFKLLVGSTISPCVSSKFIWSCPIILSNGTQGLIVWDQNATVSYKPASQYLKYQELDGGVGTISGNIKLTVAPVLLYGGVGQKTKTTPTISVESGYIDYGKTDTATALDNTSSNKVEIEANGKVIATGRGTVTYNMGLLEAGTYNVIAVDISNKKNSTAVIVKVKKATPQLTLTLPANFVYDGKGGNVTFKVSTVNNQLMAYLITQEHGTTSNYTTKTSTSSYHVTQPDVSTYSAQVVTYGNANYTATNTSIETFKIMKK
jgi:hypothetical protein